MRFRDQSNYLAEATCKHISEKVGGASFAKRVFEYDSNHSNQIQLWGGYRISILDMGSKIRLDLDSNEGGVENLVEALKEKAHIPKKYQGVLKDVNVSNVNGLSLEAEVVKVNNSQGRVQNRDKLFMALYHSAIQPVISAVHESL